LYEALEAGIDLDTFCALNPGFQDRMVPAPVVAKRTLRVTPAGKGLKAETVDV
jgi:hypothetical protein